jgi:hypothetical protein
MRRREFLAILGGAITVPGALCAQQKPMPVIGFLGAFPPAMSAQIALEQAAFQPGAE